MPIQVAGCQRAGDRGRGQRAGAADERTFVHRDDDDEAIEPFTIRPPAATVVAPV